MDETGLNVGLCLRMNVAIERHVRELDRLREDLVILDRQIAEGTMDASAIRRQLRTCH
ncbi:hypothetical protein [Mesorhizobium sp.]|uniref:hypothetical protein n=1 Tax=Mesorhizobium sp. TaxID=1871066 RepID=UPI0025884B18|nr:hypothetical protein [Mesorhizobium sp.]